MTSTDLKNQIDAQITNETAVAGITPTDVGSNMKSIVDYTDQEAALKAPLVSPTFTGTVSGITKTMVGLANVDNTSDLSKPISTATQSALDLKAPLVSPTFTGTVSGITKAMVGLANVDNTSDLSKPVSTATQSALDLKAPLVSPTFTGTVSGITKAMVGLANVDNTSDLSKPISTATQSALDLKAPIGKTIGNIEADNISPYQTLSFDMNKVNTTGSVDKVVLPTTTVIGKEVIVFALNNGASFSVRANTAGTALLSPNGISSLSTSVSISANVSYRFIHLGDSYWKAELI